ncbi:hypothetical protein M569_14569, partial [Genlisea aurea]
AGVILAYFYLPYWRLRRIPGPPAIPFIGHLHLLHKHGPDLFSTLARRYGPIFRFHMGRQPLIIVADAELCREVGIKKFKYFSNRSIPSPIRASPLHKKGLFWSKDSRWSAMRNTILSVYQPSHLSKLIPVMEDCICSATRNLDAKRLAFSDLSLRLATDVIGRAAFGVNFALSKDDDDEDESVGDDDHYDVHGFINQHIYSTTQLKMDLSGSV